MNCIKIFAFIVTVSVLILLFYAMLIGSVDLSGYHGTFLSAHKLAPPSPRKSMKNLDNNNNGKHDGHLTGTQLDQTTKCTEEVKRYLLENVALTDKSLVHLYSVCIKEKTYPAAVDPELFARLFVSDVFNHTVTCDKPQIGVVAGSPRPLVALPSFPGSGNTWTRVLLDQMTGIYTGSVYSDSMSNKILKGSKICPYRKVFIIKTHRLNDKTTRCGKSHLNYTKAIYILRSPYDATLAEFNRLHAGKIKAVSREVFEKGDWNKRAVTMPARWGRHVTYWLSTFDRPVHVLVYEELVKNTLWELYKVSKFLDYPVSYETMWCIQYRTDAQKAFRRKKPDWMSPEVLYTQEQKKFINNEIEKLYPVANNHNGLNKYLESYVLN